jgi:ASC-1-like (ASCH) protein
MESISRFPRKHISGRYFEDILKGRKVAEGRALSDFWNTDLVGKIIEIYQANEYFYVKIVNVNIYEGRDLREAIYFMLTNEGISVMLPDLREDQMNEAIDKYLSFNKGNEHLKKMGAFYVEVI